VVGAVAQGVDRLFTDPEPEPVERACGACLDTGLVTVRWERWPERVPVWGREPCLHEDPFMVTTGVPDRT
jgi:hypothetical protein